MIRLVKTSLLAAAVSVGLSLVAAPAFAQTKPPPTCDPKTQKCGCSPGYYKNHLDFWYLQPGVCSVPASGVPDCNVLLAALVCKGSDASCGRSAAAAYLDSVTGCTE